MTAQPHEPITQAEFPAWELRQEAKHEFVNGHVYGFAGGTQAHNRIATELTLKIAPAARPCLTYGSDMLIEMATSTRYADVVVTCDKRDDNPNGTVIHFPKLVVEVLSESTANEDVGMKMREYQAIDTLQEYLLIDSRKRWVQVSRRNENDRWELIQPTTTGLIELHSLAITLDLDEVYAAAGIPK